MVVIVFAVLLDRMNIADHARRVTERSADSLNALRDPQLDDLTRERVLRGQAIGLLGLSAGIIGLSGIAVIVPLGVLWLMDLAGLASMPGVLAVLQRPAFLLVATAIGSGAYLVSRRLTRG